MENNYNQEQDNQNQYAGTEDSAYIHRTCARCGCKLVAGSRFDLCDDCRRKDANNMRKNALKVGSALLVVAGVAGKIIKAISGNNRR